MPRLMLLRHAKSSWDAPEMRDFDRPLNARGRHAAPLMGRHMAAHALLPDRILCSSARRTRETLAGLLPHFDKDFDIRLTRALYESSRAHYLDVIRGHGDAARHLLVVGHNPAMQEVAIDLVGAGNPQLIQAIAADYPTAALAVIDFPEKSWSDIRPAGGRIVAFFRPRELEVVETDGGGVDD